jgi:RNA recognition motif-containing protein
MVVKFADAKVEPKMGEKRLLSPEAMQNPAKRTYTGGPMGMGGMGNNFGGGYGGGYGGGMNQFGGGGGMMDNGMGMGPGGYDNSGYGGMDHRGGFGGMDHRGGFGGMDHRGGGYGGMDRPYGGMGGGPMGGPGGMHHMGGPMDMGGPMGGGGFGGMGGGPKGMGSGGPMSMAEEAKQWKLFIGQVPFDATEQDLWPFFSHIGPILELVILRNSQGQSKGCAFVTYENRQLAEQCIRQLDGQISLPKDTRGRKLNIKWSGGDNMQGVQQAPKMSGNSNAMDVEASKAWKLFVGQVPFNVNESDLWPYFSAIGNILELVILRAPTGESKGCAFLTYSDKQSADACISQLDGRLILPNDPRSRALQIKYSASAGGEVGGSHTQSTSQTGGPRAINPQHSMTANRLGTGLVTEESKRWKLFIGQVPFTATEVDLWPYFAQIGTISELVVLRTPEGSSKGCAFCTYEGRELAEMAVQTLNNRIVLPGDIRNKPLSVRYADPSLN